MWAELKVLAEVDGLKSLIDKKACTENVMKAQSCLIIYKELVSQFYESEY